MNEGNTGSGFDAPVNTEEQDIAKINEYLSKDGVKEELTSLTQEIASLPGKTLLYGVTSDGLVVAVREGVGSSNTSDYFKAWAVDTALPISDTDHKIDTSFSYYSTDRLRDGGTTKFPGARSRIVLQEIVNLSDDEIRAKYPDDEGMVNYARFFKKTGGFYVPTPLNPNLKPTIGGNKVYEDPLPKIPSPPESPTR